MRLLLNQVHHRFRQLARTISTPAGAAPAHGLLYKGPPAAQQQQQTKTKVFIRQPFTESGCEEKEIVQSAMNEIQALQVEANLEFLTPTEAQDGSSFRESFEAHTGIMFTAKNFRNYRIGLLKQAHMFYYIRTAMSESGAFELANNAYGRKIPVFFAVWEKTPIKTTLLRDLEDLCPCTYVTFACAKDLRAPLRAFLSKYGSLHV